MGEAEPGAPGEVAELSIQDKRLPLAEPLGSQAQPLSGGEQHRPYSRDPLRRDAFPMT